MAKFINDLDITKAVATAKRSKSKIDKLIGSDKSLVSAIGKLTSSKNVICYIFSKSMAFRIGKSSVKTINGFSSGYKSGFAGSALAKDYFNSLRLPSSNTNYSKTDKVYLTCLYYLLYFKDRVKSESDKTEAVESEQVLKVQSDLRKLIKEYGSVRLSLGKETYDVDNFKQVSGRPKADMVFTFKGTDVIFVSHKKGGAPGAFQQYGGFIADLGIKNKDDSKKYTEIFKFLTDVDMVLAGLGVSKDKDGRYDLNDLRKGSNMARLISNDKIAYIVMFGKDYTTGRLGFDNCSILIDGDIIFKPKRLNTFELKGSYHTKLNPVLERVKKPFKSNANDVYSPVMFIMKSEQQGLKQAGLTNARAVIWPNNTVAQTYTKQFDDMLKIVKSKNKNRIKSLKEEYKK